MDMGRFENLGDNCEFGFVQTRLGHHEGALLRWAFARPEALLNLLTLGADGLYQLDNLEPWDTSVLLRDRKYGIGFHSRIAKADGVFTGSEAERVAVHAEEAAKMAYLIGKFRSNAKDPARIYVYKSPDSMPAIEAEIMALFAARFSGSLLLMTASNAGRAGTVERLSERVLRGHIDRFAPYHQADDISLDSWSAVLAAAIAACDKSTAPAKEKAARA